MKGIGSFSHRSRLLAVVATAAALAVIALVLQTTPANGQTGGSTSTLGNAGVLRLRLGATDNWRFQVPASSPPGHYVDGSLSSQSIGVSNGCRLSPTTGNLVALSATGGNVGFVSDSIGVRGNNEGNGQPCGRIDSPPGQTLTLDLGSDLSGKMIDFAEIDTELKFGATLVIKGYAVDGADVTQVGQQQEYSSVGSDSGPDSADGDNYRIRFPKTGTTAVNRLVFSIKTTGGASLEGGADGTRALCVDPLENCSGSLGQTIDDTATTDTTTSDSLFHLVEADGVLSCTDNGSNGVTQGGDGTPQTTIERFSNVDGGTCTPIPFNQDSSVSGTEACATGSSGDFAQCIVFQKDLLGQQAQFVWTVAWAPEPGTYQESPTEFDFGAGFNPITLCNPDDNDADTLPELSGNGDPFCVFDTHTVLVGGDPGAPMVQVTEKYYGVNDPGGSRH